MRGARLLALAAALTPGAATAHELAPGLVRIEAVGPQAFHVTWRPPTPAQDDLQIRIAPPCAPLPEAGSALGGAGARLGAGARTEAVVRCPAGVAPQVRRDGGAGAEVLVIGPGPDAVRSAPWREAAAEATGAAREPRPLGLGGVLTSYVALGVTHILGGLDHLAFVLGLLLLVRAPRRVVAVLTAFTVGHSVTLAAAAVGVARLPAAPVEASIALSIVFVAREALLGDAGGRPRAPVVAAVGFGLLHGFGFAGALAALGLPPGFGLPALFAFNLGVELGQLGVVVGVLAGLRLTGLGAQAGLRRPAALALGVGAALLTLERVSHVLRWT